MNTGNLNVRTGPGMGYGSIATLPFGFGVQMVARNSEGNWILIQLTNGVNGWVNVNYLFTQYNTNSLPVSDVPVAPTVTPTARVTGALNANLRNGPSTDNAVIGTIPLNETVVLLGRNYNSTWAQVRRSNGAVGWVEATALTGTVPVRSLSLADGSVFVPYAPSYPGENTTGTNYRTHVVVAGDSLSRLAERYATTMYAIAAANNIYNYDLIYIGQSLIIPG
ncbi:MAG: SH3 domain-containing protein [Anaerolineae bacterium]|nr:SH3 domain-containing protein [Anaerolineae bacterium]